MTYSIVYSSKSGNTALLAEKIKSEIPVDKLLYFGPPSTNGATADTIILGFWTDKGTCDETLKSFIQGLNHQNIILFGTAGFGGSDTYFDQIIGHVSEIIPDSCTLKGAFMCQGKMPLSIRGRYVQALAKDPTNSQIKAFIENFDCALDHPNEADLNSLSVWLHSIL